MFAFNVGHYDDSDAVQPWHIRNKPTRALQAFSQCFSVFAAESQNVKGRLYNQPKTQLFNATLEPFGVAHACVHGFLEAFFAHAFEDAQVEAAEAPVLVPTNVYWVPFVR